MVKKQAEKYLNEFLIADLENRYNKFNKKSIWCTYSVSVTFPLVKYNDEMLTFSPCYSDKKSHHVYKQIKQVKSQDYKMQIWAQYCKLAICKEDSTLFFEVLDSFDLLKDISKLKCLEYISKHNQLFVVTTLVNYLQKNKRQKNIEKYFAIFTQGANENIKKAIAVNICCISISKRFDFFRLLLKKADKETQKILALNLYKLKIQDRFNGFKLFNEKNCSEVRKVLIEQLFLLQDEESAQWVIEEARTAKNEIKLELAKNLFLLSDIDRIDAFYAINQYSNNDVKKALLYSLWEFQKEDRKECFNELLKNTDKEFLAFIKENASSLPEECRR